MRKIFTIRFLIPLLFLAVSSIKGLSQTIAWNFTAGTATPSTTSPTIATSSDLVQGNNNGTTTFITTTSASSGYAGASGTFNAGLAARVGALNTAANGSAYVEFTLTPVSGQTVTLTAISFGTRSTGTGAQAYTLRSSLDAYASDITTGTIANNSAWSLKSNTGLSVISGIGTAITFRIYGYNGAGAPSAGTANWRLDDITLSVTGASTNADLSNLALSAGTLVPVFSAATTSYTAGVANAVTSITVTATAADVNSTITVNGNAVTSGSPSGSIALAEGPNVITTVVTAQDAVTTKTYTVTVTRAAAGVATVSITTSLPDFGAVCINTTTSASSFKITGTDLNGSNIDLAALPGFTYCETVGGTYTTTLSFTYTAPGFTDKEIFVKFNPTAVQSYNGDIILSGGGLAATVPVPASGSGVNTTLAITTGGSAPVTATSGTPAGIINVAGCTAITAYGIEYSTTSGFADGTGTKINATNLSGSNYSVTLTGLIPNTRYYYKAYATVDGGATFTYGLQQAFNCLPLAVPMIAQSNLTFTETFSDIANWSDFFITGTGANHWDGLSSTATAPASGIPNPTIITHATNSFQNPSGIPPTPSVSDGVQKGTDQTVPTQSIVLLATNPTNNTRACALDFYVDFTGVNAGTLSFDYTTINNGAGDRPGSLRVYYSVDGVSFTELTNLLNFTNNIPLSGSKSNIPLPAALNNNANVRFRFYDYNGETGGTSGARPKISIDNLKITALATTPCVTPTAPATALIFGTITDVSIQGSFTAASPATDNYIVVMSTSSSLTGSPVNGQIYNIGDNLGDGTVIANGSATSFTATGLSPLTTYYFFVFPVNAICTGGPLYFGTSLDGNTTTIAGLPPCAAPAGQPSNYVAGTTTVNTIQGSFTATTANEYLVLRTTTPPLTNNPVDGVAYNAGDILGNAVVVQRSAATSFTATGLLPNTTYNFYVFALNSQACVNGPAYNITAPLPGVQATQPLPLCTTPSAQPTVLTLTPANTSVAGTFTGVVDADDYLVVISSSSTLSASPVDNTDYNTGDALGGGTVIANSANTSFLATGLTPNTLYYFFVFAANKTCSGGTKYVSANPLTGNITTSNTVVNKYYFGNLHAHSDYSDGNTDNPGYTPALDYDYAMTAECMDFLGISEHNHNQTGTTLSNYHLGVTQANDFSTAHPNFLAIYGMEWGTIGSGGHVLIYGNGMDNLWGWESGAGAWGSSNNYDVYVNVGDYISPAGVFKTANDNIATNTFVSLAHPGLNDFDSIASVAPYSVVTDNAITAVAVESGPSTSSNTTYSNPAFSMGYLWYYQTLLAKGYHLGPTIDHDNHKTTFGKTTRSRTAVIAPGPNLTKAAMMTAMRNMNFYATQDCDTKVDFSINTRIMGSIFTDRFAPNISVTLTDATTSTAAAVIRVMYGVPGSGILPVKIDSAIGSSLTFTDNNLANNATGYYYIDITNGSSRIVTSPIWYTRNDNLVLPVKLSSFVVQKTDNAVKISWSTEQEINSSYFVVERSADGRNWNNIATVNAAGNSSIRMDYSIYDNAPMKGINYYRLKLVDKDAKYDYSVTRTALFSTKYAVEVAPNPAKDVVNIYLAKTNNQPATIQLLNAAGKIVYTASSAQSHVQINTTGFGKGLYFVKVIAADDVTTIRVLVQ